MRAFRFFLDNIVIAGDDARGDFIRDSRQDRSFPVVRDWYIMKFYLESKYACTAAITAAAKLWLEYLKWRSMVNDN